MKKTHWARMYKDRQRILGIKLREVLWYEDGVGIKAFHFFHDSLVVTRSAIFYDT